MSEEMKEIAEMSDEEIETYEGNIIDALMEASNYKNDSANFRTVKIVRNRKLLFSFTVRPLSEGEFAKCRRQNIRNRGKRNEEVDVSRQRSQIIYTATVEEDKKRVWNNVQAWRSLNVASGVDAVDEVLNPGEKVAITDIIDEISGYREDVEEMIKN